MTGRRFLALIAVAMLAAACSSANAGDETADGSGGELGWKAGGKQLHLPPMVLHPLTPVMQILIAIAGEPMLEGFAGFAIAKP